MNGLSNAHLVATAATLYFAIVLGAVAVMLETRSISLTANRLLYPVTDRLSKGRAVDVILAIIWLTWITLFILILTSPGGLFGAMLINIPAGIIAFAVHRELQKLRSAEGTLRRLLATYVILLVLSTTPFWLSVFAISR